MSDEMECFTFAAELGCRDFHLEHPLFSYGGKWEELPRIATLSEQADGTDAPQRINRYAAAVCAEFFDDRALHEVNRARPTMRRYRNMARAFGKKYGAA